MLLDDECSLNNTSLSEDDSIFGAQEIISNPVVIKGNIACGKISWPVAVPPLGTVHTSSYTPNRSYGSFNKSHVVLETDEQNNLEHISPETIDNDSGMSSGENEDSVKCSYNNNRNNNVSDKVSSTEVIKCLTNENKRAVHRNEIPSCSNVKDTGIDDVMDVVDFDGVSDRFDSDFIVINLSCEREESIVGTSVYNIDCDNSSILGSSQSLVPVANNELVKSESQKLVSLSLSILLAAILQAMRCFAQFLEDIVTPQRL